MKLIKQMILTQTPTAEPSRVTEKIAFFNADGTPSTGRDQQFAPVTTTSAIGTVGKSVPDKEPAANTVVPVLFTNGNSASSPTIAFNGGTARAIKLGGVAVTGAKLTVAAGGVVLFFFDGTVLHQLGTVA